MTPNDLVPFSIGVATGAAALFIPWIAGPFRKYVINCRKAMCPHHGEGNRKHINDINDRTRNGPTRPNIR